MPATAPPSPGCHPLAHAATRRCHARIALNTSPSPHAIEPSRIDRPPIAVVVMQHVEEAAHLRHVRSVLVRAPHVGLLHLGRLDERIAAHLDGIAVAAEYGTRLAQQALERPGSGEVFVATVRAIEDRDAQRLDKLLAIAEAVPASRAGLLSAFGWVSAADLQGITKALLEAVQPWRREVGLAACAMHGVDPGSVLAGALRDGDSGLRARALRVAGQCGRRDLLDACLAALTDEDERCAFEAARSALWLGDRAAALAALEALAVKPGAGGQATLSALRAVLKVVAPTRAQGMLALLAKDAALIRSVIRGIAIAGDPHHVPWLIAQMEDLKLARLAGEAFSFITGLDLAYLDLERKPPENMEFGPNDDPDDDNVAMDEDDSLPWPDPVKLAAWWQANGARFTAGTRYFMGAVPTPAHCLHVLASGFQRQRIAAAQYLTLFAPGTPLFNTFAPTRRQQRLLAKMGA
jgi:uncharacterized protein (TIGR02270 family)